MKTYNRGEKEYKPTVDYRETSVWKNNVGYYETIQYIFAEDEATTFIKLYKDKYKRLILKQEEKEKELMFFQDIIDYGENYGILLNDEYLIAYIYADTPPNELDIRVRQVIMLYNYQEDVIVSGSDEQKIAMFNEKSNSKLVMNENSPKLPHPLRRIKRKDR